MRMYWLLLGLLALALTRTGMAADAQKFGDGVFVGMEPMTNLSPDEPKARWFHENTLTITGDKVVLSKSPVIINKGKRWSSASDGGFFTYRGSLKLIDGRWNMVLLQVFSDYAPVRVDKNGVPIPSKPETIEITRTKDGSLLVEKIIYRKKEAAERSGG